MESSANPRRYIVLYSADKHRKQTKRWHDGTLVVRANSGSLFGTPPCDLDSDPWDYEAGREKRGYRVAPFVEAVGKVDKVLAGGDEIHTQRHIITIERMLEEGAAGEDNKPVGWARESENSKPPLNRIPKRKRIDEKTEKETAESKRDLIKAKSLSLLDQLSE